MSRKQMKLPCVNRTALISCRATSKYRDCESCFADQIERSTRPAEDSESAEEEQPEEQEKEFLLLSDECESTTIGGLVSEMAGRIPAAGEVVEKDGLRMQVLASTDRRVDRLRVSLALHPEALPGESSSQS